MTRLHSALALGGFVLGASIAARQLRRLRALDLTNRVVLITGGSRGLGLLMAREAGHHGAHVVIAARDEAELLRAQNDLLRTTSPRRRSSLMSPPKRRRGA